MYSPHLYFLGCSVAAKTNTEEKKKISQTLRVRIEAEGVLQPLQMLCGGSV